MFILVAVKETVCSYVYIDRQRKSISHERAPGRVTALAHLLTAQVDLVCMHMYEGNLRKLGHLTQMHVKLTFKGIVLFFLNNVSTF